MPNIVTSTGLQTASLAELVAQFRAAFQAIYGADINLDQDTPDGQMMMIFLQAVIDLQDVLNQVYNGFDPDNAIGRVLDQRVALNGIQRKAGTYTITDVTVVTTQAVTLNGINQVPDSPYTISDAAGTRWVLLDSFSPAGPFPSSDALVFRAALPGETLTVPNTITIPISVVLGVQSVNNPTTYTSLGLNEETDAQLRIRRQKSVALASQGFLSGLVAALNNINGVTTALVYENTTGATDGNGVPSHSIWVIIGGAADPEEIATAIYNKRNAGCGMFGAETFTITQVDGTPFVIKWDYSASEDLYIRFTLTSIDGTTPPAVARILENLPVSLGALAGVGTTLNVNEVATLVQEIDDNSLVTFPTGQGLSLTEVGGYQNILSPSALNLEFSIDAARIIILPIVVTPASAILNDGGATQQFTAAGGLLPYTWSMVSGGGSINSSGLYTSGVAGSDVARVTDAEGNFTNIPITVA